MFNALLYFFAGLGLFTFLLGLALLYLFMKQTAKDLDEYEVAQRELVAYATMLALINDKGGKH